MGVVWFVLGPRVGVVAGWIWVRVVWSVEIAPCATVAAAIPADGDEDVAEEGILVDGGEMGEVSVGEVGGDVPFLGS